MTTAEIISDIAKQPHAAKRLARLAAVQSLYQMGLTGAKPDDAVADVLRDPSVILVDADDGVGKPPVDSSLLADIVKGVSRDQGDIDRMVAGVFDKGPLDRMEPLLRAIMAAGAYELHQCPKTATGVIINDYVDITHSFFNDREPGLVNAMLDRLAKTLRAV